jgi:hypothetical protein
MHRTIRTAVAALAVAALMALAATPASASEPPMEDLNLGNGWSLQSPTTKTVVTAESYKSQILQPINADGTSTWPAKRGVIPVQFKLTKSSETVTTYDPSFQSVCSGSGWSYLGYVPPAGTTVNSITSLAADFTWVEGQSIGGSLRWQIDTPNGNLFIYYGEQANWTGTGGSGVDLWNEPGLRFDTGQFPGGTFYDSKEHMLDLIGDFSVKSAALIVDSCWKDGDQVVDLHSATFNGSTKIIPPTVSVTTSTGTPVQTNEPPAHIKVVRQPTDTTPSTSSRNCRPPRATPPASSVRSTASTCTTLRLKPSVRASLRSSSTSTTTGRTPSTRHPACSSSASSP